MSPLTLLLAQMVLVLPPSPARLTPVPHAHTRAPAYPPTPHPAVSVEVHHMRARHDWVLNPSVMIANALTAFVLNLVSARAHGHGHGQAGRHLGDDSLLINGASDINAFY